MGGAGRTVATPHTQPQDGAKTFVANIGSGKGLCLCCPGGKKVFLNLLSAIFFYPFTARLQKTTFCEKTTLKIAFLTKQFRFFKTPEKFTWFYRVNLKKVG